MKYDFRKRVFLSMLGLLLSVAIQPAFAQFVPGQIVFVDNNTRAKVIKQDKFGVLVEPEIPNSAGFTRYYRVTEVSATETGAVAPSTATPGSVPKATEPVLPRANSQTQAELTPAISDKSQARANANPQSVSERAKALWKSWEKPTVGKTPLPSTQAGQQGAVTARLGTYVARVITAYSFSQPDVFTLLPGGKYTTLRGLSGTYSLAPGSITWLSGPYTGPRYVNPAPVTKSKTGDSDQILLFRNAAGRELMTGYGPTK